eukprot:7277265-Prorocentrum_lima.AAC.1
MLHAVGANGSMNQHIRDRLQMWQRRDLQQLYAEVMMTVGRQSLRAPMGAQTPAQRRAKKAQAITKM